MIVLETIDLVKRFGGPPVINGLSLTLRQGEILGLIGPNGAGKTTFLNCVAGNLRCDGGQVRFLGEDISRATAAYLCKKGLARTFQIPRLFPKMTALENVMVSAVFGRPPGTAGDAGHWAERVLEYVEFPCPLDTPAENLNTVQLKCLDLARALASKPKLLLLDELAAGLTSGELDDLMRIILRIRHDGTTVVLVEHIMRVILGLCDRVAVIHYGEKISEGRPEEVARDPNVVEAYLGNQKGNSCWR